MPRRWAYRKPCKKLWASELYKRRKKSHRFGATFVVPRELFSAGFRFGFGSFGFGKFLVEFVDAAVRLDEALFAGVERMAIRAGINLDFFHGRTSFEGGSAADAGHGALVVLRMDSLFHVLYSFRLAGNCRKESYGCYNTRTHEGLQRFSPRRKEVKCRHFRFSAERRQK